MLYRGHPHHQNQRHNPEITIPNIYLVNQHTKHVSQQMAKTHERKKKKKEKKQRIPDAILARS
jgi:hypothetical protein